MRLPEGDEHFVGWPEQKGYQFKKYAFFREHFIRRGLSCAIDVGAHVGYWTNHMAMDFDVIHSFEPISENYRCLLENKPDKCIAYNFGLGIREEEKTLYLGSRTNSGAWSSEKGDREIEETIQLRTLDSFELEPDLIKIDVEGSQRAVLIGATETLKRCKPTIIVEVEDENRKRKVTKFLKDLGASLARNYGKDCMYQW
jgi:FkbM family methyltransferase